jgi:TonB-linked SusC/RagA family outer membrane protein
MKALINESDLNKFLMLVKMKKHGCRSTCFGEAAAIAKMLVKNYLPFHLLMALCLIAGTKANTQGISLSVKNSSISKVFEQIEAQSEVRFFYRSESLKKARKVSLQAENAPLKDVLERCFQNQPLTYEIIEKIVVVKEKFIDATANVPTAADSIASDFTTVRGRVINTEGEPVEGATITVKGTATAAASNASGEFTVPVKNSTAVLEVTSVAIEPVEVQVANKKELVVHVETRISALDQVQIIGYGQTTRRLNTGNVVTIKAEQIQKQPVSHVLAALQGRVAGMAILQNTGIVGGSFQTLIRGKGSIAAGSHPLFIIDGVPYPDGFFGTNNSAKSGVNALGLLNVNEIERVEILKDADATAIYGSRGGNGVVLITTKRGKPGQTSIDLNVYSGFGKATVRPRLLNLQQYLQMRHETLRNDSTALSPIDYDINGTWDTTRYTDWSKELLGGTVAITDGKLSITGGTSSLNYSINGGYHRETTVMPVSGSNQRYGVHFHVANMPAEKKFKIELSGTYQAGVDDLPPVDFTQILTYLKPNQPPSFLPDGSLDVQNIFNPYIALLNRYKWRQHSLVSYLKASWAPVKGLNLSMSAGYNTQALNDFKGNPSIPIRPFSFANYATNNNHSLILEPQAFYEFQRKRHGKLSVLIGTTYQKSASAFQNLSASGFSNDALLGNPAAAAELKVYDYGYRNYKYLGSFSRLSYNRANKYIVNLTSRVDGTSRFGPGKQFHPFGAVGAAWILSDEPFMRRLKWLHFAKLRGSYGVIGNSEIRDYAFVETYEPYLAPYQGIQGLTPNQLFDRNLGWELKKSAELALELQLFQNRIAVSVCAYRNRNSQQLVRTSLSTVTGFWGVASNWPAVVQNRGLEVVLYGQPLSTRQFSWTIDANASFQKNKLLRFEGLERSQYGGSYHIGESITTVHLFKFGGVDPQSGKYFYIDRYGRPTATPTLEDRTERIDIAPRSYGGITNSFSSKGWSFDVTCYYMVKQGANVTRTSMLFIESVDRWQKPGDVTTIAKYSLKRSSSEVYNLALSTAGLGDASYIRVRNIALSYRFKPGVLERAHLQNLRLYLLAQNLFTFTRVRQLDPETIDQQHRMAPQRVLTCGFQITL